MPSSRELGNTCSVCQGHRGVPGEHTLNRELQELPFLCLKLGISSKLLISLVSR